MSNYATQDNSNCGVSDIRYLYLVSAANIKRRKKYDIYTDFVVCTTSADRARCFLPGSDICDINVWNHYLCSSVSSFWISKDQIDLLDVTLLGVADKTCVNGIILDSFIAG